MQKNKLSNNLELIIGPVCSGKSSELIRRIDRYAIAGYSVLVLKPKVDTRSSKVEARNGRKIACVSISNVSEIYDAIVDFSLDNDTSVDIIALDEAQFFSDSFTVIKDLLHKGFKVIVSALDSDYNGESFGDITKLVILSDSVLKMTGICMSCLSDNAIYSQKLRKGGNQIEIGNLELYHPRCISCFIPGGMCESSLSFDSEID